MYRLMLKSCRKEYIPKNLLVQSRNYARREEFRQAGFGKFVIILAPFAAVGGVITYAKYDNEFRKTLVKNVPGVEPILKVVFQEENPLQEITKKVDNVTATVTNLFSGSEKKSDEKIPSPAKKSDVKVNDIKKPTSTKVDDKKSTEKFEIVPMPAMSKPVESIPSEVSELEKAVEIAADLAVQEYNKAIKILNIYNEDVKKVVDEAIEKLDSTAWMSLRNKTSSRDTAIETAEKAARAAVQNIDKYSIALSNAASSVSLETLETLRNKIRKYSDHINGVKDELYRAKDSARLSEKYWKKVESARNYFLDEIESLFPGLSLSEKKLNLSKEDLDLFILHAYSHVLSYQKELQRLQLEGENRLRRAIDALKSDDQTEAVKTQLEYHLDRERRNLALDHHKKIFQIKADTERELKLQLKRQAQAHVDHIQDAISQKEAELRRIFAREMDEKISTEKAAYKLQLASMLGKLKGMDSALKARAESERCAHQAMSLWAACQALWSSVRTGEPGIHWQQKLRPLKNEISAVSAAAAEGDELVTVVLQNLPEEAQTRGVYPEDALRDRFLNVERVARKLALVPEEGAGLLIYLLSYIQSVLIMRPEHVISEEEILDKRVDFSKLDTYDILNRARYYMDRGDLIMCLRYMNLLQGASRKIARDWLKEARLLLETQQAANTLMAHAAASGLLYL